LLCDNDGGVMREYLAEVRGLKLSLAAARRRVHALHRKLSADVTSQERLACQVVAELEKIKAELNYVILAGHEPPHTDQFTYEGHGQTDSVIPEDPKDVTRHHGASILCISPRPGAGVGELHMSILLNCHCSEPNSVRVAVFQDDSERPLAVLTEHLIEAELTMIAQDFVASVANASHPPVFEIRVGLAHSGDTLSLNHVPGQDGSAAFASAVRLRWLHAENDIAAAGSASHALKEARDEIVRLKVAAEETLDYQLLMDHQEKLVAFNDADPTFRLLYEHVKPYTMTSIERLYALYKATEYVLNANVLGDFVECGVWRGGSMMMTALTAIALGNSTRRLFLFDTFEGHPKPDREKDGAHNFNEWQSRRILDRSSHWARESLEDVRRNVESTGYPVDKIIFVKGMVQDTLAANAPESISLLRLDTDWYDSTAYELKYLYPRLSDRGVLILDDYGSMPGARRATDEYFKERRDAPLFNRIDYSGRIAVKQQQGAAELRSCHYLRDGHL
jgi:hypothetical protein